MASYAIGAILDAVVTYLREDGSPGRVDGVPVWANSAPAVASLEVAADGMSAVITVLAEGVTQITAEGDGDLGAGVRPVIAAAEVTGLGAEVQTARMDLTERVV